MEYESESTMFPEPKQYLEEMKEKFDELSVQDYGSELRIIELERLLGKRSGHHESMNLHAQETQHEFALEHQPESSCDNSKWGTRSNRCEREHSVTR